MREVQYRADIDGLRAVSALAIFAFHLGFSGFSGGFVGVDIFFVISGYLIVPKIVEGLESKSFSLKSFFEKRIRRILPALLLVMFFSFVVGFFILGPREYREFALSALSTLGFAANFFFNDRSDYFADAAHQKPFLHAWSLGVEEQFYIVVPLLLMALYGALKLSPRKTILTITILSFIYNVAWVRIDETNAFYLPMSRFWELGLGGLIALYTSGWAVSRGMALLTAFVGVFLLIAAIFIVDDTVMFPGEAALIPVLGAALLIFAGQYGRNPVNQIMGTLPFRYVGRLSYSLYLIHWPVIVFTRLYLSRPLELTEQISILAFGFVWAALSWHLMERYILDRRSMSFRAVIVGVGTAILLIGGFGTYTSLRHGIPDRMSEKSTAVIEDVAAEKAYKYAPCESSIILGGVLPDKYAVCRKGDPAGANILFWGDSHSGMLVHAFERLYGSDGNYISSTGMADCPPMPDIETTRRKNRDICPLFVDKVMGYLETHKVDLVVLASRWANLASSVRSPGDGGRSHTIFDLADSKKVMSFEAALTRSIKKIRRSGADVLVVGPVPEIAFHVPDTIIRTFSGIGKLPTVARHNFDIRQQQVLSALEKIEAQGLAEIIYPHKYLCNESACDVIRNGRVLYTDDDHLSTAGARPIVRILRERFIARK